jgi:hypothetical protein
MWSRLYIALDKSWLSVAEINTDLDLKEVKICWDHRSVTDRDRAFAVWIAMTYGENAIRVNILTWFFQSPRFRGPLMDEVIMEMQFQGVNPTFDDAFFIWNRPLTVELLTAVIRTGAPFQDTETLLSTLLRTGGVALAEIAIRCGYPLRFPSRLSTIFYNFCGYINDNFIRLCRANRVDTSWVQPVFAVYIQDLRLLRIPARSPGTEPVHHLERVGELMLLAVRKSWVEGVRHIALIYPTLRPDRRTLNEAFSLQDRACWDALLGINQTWLDAAFTVACIDFGNFAEMEALARNGALSQPMQNIVIKPYDICPSEWLDIFRRRAMGAFHMEGIGSPRDRSPLWELSPSERLFIYAGALVDQQVALSMTPRMAEYINRWVRARVSFLKWWEPNARGRHHPDHFTDILEVAGYEPPEVWRQAERVAARIRQWAGLRGASHTVLDLISMMVMSGTRDNRGSDRGRRNRSTARWLQQ